MKRFYAGYEVTPLRYEGTKKCSDYPCNPGICPKVATGRRRNLNSILHPAIFLEMVKFVDLGVLYFSLVFPGQPTWVALGQVSLGVPLSVS